jgi:hypothetical protein
MFGEDAVQHIDFLPDAWRNYGCLRELFIDMVLMYVTTLMMNDDMMTNRFSMLMTKESHLIKYTCLKRYRR